MTFPGFIDVHVHFRDPGMCEAETTASGLMAAKAGGFSAVVTMPNTTPAGDGPEGINYQLNAAREAELVDKPVLIPAAAITVGRAGTKVANLEASAEAGAAFFTDDGGYVKDAKVMEEAMLRIADLGMVVCEHAMDPVLQNGGVIRDCALARKHNLPIISVATEVEAIKRDISLCRVTGCRLHIQHISTAEGVNLVCEAQKEGLPVTAEATPHHLLLSCDELTVDDANFKMAPPLGNNEDRAELRRAVKAGVLMFATDHAPHPAHKKSAGFLTSANGIIGLETAIPITYKVMVEDEGMSIADWAKAWSELPAAIISKFGGFDVRTLKPTELAIEDLKPYNLSKSVSRSRNCPYDQMSFRCWPVK